MTSTTTTTEPPLNLHNLAGPPYQQSILPNATLLLFEEELLPNIQYLPGYAASSAILETAIVKGKNSTKIPKVRVSTLERFKTMICFKIVFLVLELSGRHLICRLLF